MPAIIEIIPRVMMVVLALLLLLCAVELIITALENRIEKKTRNFFGL